MSKNVNEAAQNLKDRIKQINQQSNPDAHLKLVESEESSSSESEQENEDAININNLISLRKIDDHSESDRKNEILQLKKEIISIKRKTMVDSNEHEFDKEEENHKLTPLQQYQSKFLHLKKGRSSGKEAIEKVMKFKDKLKNVKSESENWMNNKLKFHVDSQKAYAINETNEKILKGFDLSISMNK